MRLGPSNQGVTCAMTVITAETDTEMTFAVCKDLRSVSIDGKEISLKKTFVLE
jgi:hypothetical protein